MKKKWSYFKTNYRQAWHDYRKTDDYAQANNVLKNAGIRQPYRDNILKNAFAAGWNATKKEIKQI
jgi:hypothetical protein